MENIVNSLLALARCESGRQAIARAPVAISDLVKENWRPLAERAAARQLQVVCEIPRGIRLETDRALLGIILTNIFSNAVDHTPRGGAIRIHGEQRAHQFALSVANPVNNLSADDLPHLFERFWRKDAARTTSGHAGLGLSLARAFADLLGLTLTAKMTDSMLVFTLQGAAANSAPSPDPGKGIS